VVRPRLLGVAALAAIVGLGGVARASAFDVEGFGPTGIAEVNARAARTDDGTATFYNPGGLALGRGYRVDVAPQLGLSALSAQGKTLALDSPFGVVVAFDATIPLEGALKDRIRFGYGGYFLPTAALRLITRAGDTPFFPYYDNRTQRLVALPALAVRILDNLGVGVGLNVLAGVSGPADVRPGASGAPESRIDEEATTVLAVNTGVRFDPVPPVHLAFVYRQRFAVRSLVDTTAEIGGVPLRAQFDVRQALYDPDTFVLGSSFDVGRASFELDASYAIWSGYDGPYVRVEAELPGVAISSKLPDDLFRDVVSVRGAGTYRIGIGERSDVVLRLGAGLEPSILTSAQQGRTNLVDGDKVLIGAGATLTLGRAAGSPSAIRFGLGASSQIVGGYEQAKIACRAQPCPISTVVGPDGNDPGAGIQNRGYPKLTGSGSFWSASLGVGVDL